MGIRYFALSIDEQDFDHISKGRCPSCGEEPTLRELGSEDDTRDSLDLDKSWHYLQFVLRSDPPRPAAALVAGDVTTTYWGWRPHRGLLNPAQVAAIAADSATVSVELVRQRILVDGRWGEEHSDRAQQDFEYVCDHLLRAQEFTKAVAGAGRAIRYYIG